MAALDAAIEGLVYISALVIMMSLLVERYASVAEFAARFGLQNEVA